MGKRKRGNEEDRIRKKIRRLERKLRRTEGTDESDASSPPRLSRDRRAHYDDYDEIIVSDDESRHFESPSVNVRSPADSPPPRTSPPVLPQPSPERNEPTASASLIVQNDVPTLIPDEILNMLGEAKKLESPLGSKVPNEISERWGKILLNGLAKEQKELLMEGMLIPENFLLARAPKLNPEVAAVLTDTAKNRDKRLEKSQNQLGSGIAGLVNLVSDLATSDMVKLNIIKKISEISQLLLDLHFEESVNRKKLIVPLMEKNFWSIIQNVERDTFLFGDQLGEKIKNSKNIYKSSQDIKRPTPAQSFQSHRRVPAHSGNARVPPRQQNVTRMLPPVPQGRYRHRGAITVNAGTRGGIHSTPQRSRTSKTYDKRRR